ncbi:MAG: hypothetical protein IKS54_08030 [Erysipelotrichaceae bacterium]|nr:hypothetical protein [Erysipelotrichaceae bacterium]
MTLYEKIRDASRQSREEGMQEGMLKEKHSGIVRYVQTLISKGAVSTEVEACKLLDYDFNEYLVAKKEVTESEI